MRVATSPRLTVEDTPIPPSKAPDAGGGSIQRKLSCKEMKRMFIPLKIAEARERKAAKNGTSAMDATKSATEEQA